MPQRIGISEVRRRLPDLVHRIAREGGRVDVTHRGVVVASLVRPPELTEVSAAHGSGLPSALCIQLHVDAGSMIDEVRALRTRVGRPRQLPKK